ncbi:pilus assembly protein TadG-related protein [Arthrobacter sp. AK01]|uniref:pilus assembly protein TadG-related protein n=1 Tax=Micrococcaceae TaxID=1268 RepID=UPI001E640775|nr:MULTISPECIES: pilus assembly protein TadG-related protein [Micrococcaceae]MCD4849313.1 pilus assembly protein TadG-related protein [Arthrobacter sp. AK01]MCP1414681.1 putative membrane protein [Paenarthrobacter sp. A20]
MTSLRRRGSSPPVGEPREDGQIGVLVIGYVVLALLLATVVMAASAVYLEHKKLLSLADGAALAAADSFLVGDIGAGSLPATSLMEERVKATAGSYLTANGAFGRHDQLVLTAGTGSEPGGTAVVVLAAVAHPPVVSFLLPDGILVEARSVARSSLTQ